MINSVPSNAVSVPQILVVDDDLFFSVRVETTLKKLGYGVEVVGSAEKAMEIVSRSSIGLVIINFRASKYSASDLVRALKQQNPSPSVLCFMPHKQMPELKPLAREAGADLIVANSALTMRLPQLVAKLAPLDGAKPSLIEARALQGDDEDE